MPHRTLTPDELKDYLHLPAGEVERLLRESNIPHEKRGGRVVFLRGAIDAWASRQILQLKEKRLDFYHENSTRGAREVLGDDALVPELLREEYIHLELTSKTSGSVLRDLVSLADSTGRVYDPVELLETVREREAMSSTAIEGGFALPHARHHAPYRFEGSFIVLGRTIQAVPFGAIDGRSTQLFFLICCQDERLHLHTLARLCLLAMKTDVIQRLFNAESPAEAFAALQEAEQSVLPNAEADGGKRSR